jgi:hypothetical protein
VGNLEERRRIMGKLQGEIFFMLFTTLEIKGRRSGEDSLYHGKEMKMNKAFNRRK